MAESAADRADGARAETADRVVIVDRAGIAVKGGQAAVAMGRVTGGRISHQKLTWTSW
jgi:hypothetical protein